MQIIQFPKRVNIKMLNFLPFLCNARGALTVCFIGNLIKKFTIRLDSTCIGRGNI